MIAGDRVAVGLYHGDAFGTVRNVSPGFITVDLDDDNYLPGGPREIVELSRRTVRILEGVTL